MRNINEKFTDLEHNALLRAKGNQTWHDFIMNLLKFNDINIIIDNAPEFDVNYYEDFGTEYNNWLLQLKEVLG